MCLRVEVTKGTVLDREGKLALSYRNILRPVHMAVVAIWVFGIRSCVERQVIARPPSTGVKMISHKETVSRGLFKLSCGLIEVGVEALPVDTGTERNSMSKKSLSEADSARCAFFVLVV